MAPDTKLIARFTNKLGKILAKSSWTLLGCQKKHCFGVFFKLSVLYDRTTSTCPYYPRSRTIYRLYLTAALLDPRQPAHSISITSIPKNELDTLTKHHPRKYNWISIKNTIPYCRNETTITSI